MVVNCIVMLAIGLLFNITNVRTEPSNVVLETRLSALETQLSKVTAFVEGFEQLCSRFRDVKVDSIQESDNNEKESEVIEPVVESEELIEHEQTIVMIWISSSGLKRPLDSVIVSVGFQVTEEYWLIWHYSYGNYTSMRQKGQIHEQDVGSGRKEVSTIVIIDASKSPNLLSLVIETYHNQVILVFNVPELYKGGVQKFKDGLERKINKYKAKLTVSDVMLKTEGLKTTLEVSENVVKLLPYRQSIVSSYFSAINTTSTPPEFVELSGYNDDYSLMKIKMKNESTNELILSINKEYAQYGGVLKVGIAQNTEGFLHHFHYYVIIRIINKAVGGLMPAGVVVVKKYDEIRYHYGPYLSYACIGAGIPHPDISIFKVNKDGALEEMLGDEDLTFDIFRGKVVNVSPDTITEPYGTYICRVSNGNSYAESKSSIIRYEDVTFDNQKTRVMRKTADIVEISCKASGTPTPRLELRVNDEGGETLQADLNHKVSTKRNSHRVTAKISRRDQNFHSIVCVAIQNLTPYNYEERYQRIHIKEKR